MKISLLTLSVAMFSLLGFGGLMGAPQQRQYLEAGPGQRPFDVTKHSVPIEEIRGGGPPKDGIPALDNPRFVSAKEAEKFLSRQDRVLGVALNGAAKAYPLKILNWHEIVNDTVGGRPVLVTW
jgi:hypothetical protein